MKKYDICDHWSFKKFDDSSFTGITLPHDAMLFEERHGTNPGGKNISWFAGGDYIYQKEIFLPGDLSGSVFVLQFEGIYKDSEIYVNDSFVYHRPYGYTEFHADITTHVLLNHTNMIKVLVKNSDQPNSRWYTGSGIFRPVNLFVLPKEHILFNSIRIKTVDFEKRVINVKLKANGSGPILLEFWDQQEKMKSVSYDQSGDEGLNITLPETSLWGVDQPKLYTMKASYQSDVQEVTFGIRSISVDSKNGLLLNNERVILKGACIHHDNGILGATGHPFADRRKARILKEQGFNSVRSAHNPISRAFLDECDRIGLLVVDEYADMWYIHKTKYDYADQLNTWWKQDLTDLVSKDFNHPSVIMYSIGNEVSETSEPKGIALADQMTKYLHSVDYRPVTCGVNIFFNYLYSLGFGVYSDKKAEQAVLHPEKAKAVGSEFFNELAGKFGDKTMKFGAWLPGSDRKTKGVFEVLDVAGYNYGIMRYKKDLTKYPNRVILGTETFCKDASIFFEMANKHPGIIGDFVWAGMDYLGEAGAGSWVSESITTDHSFGPGWISAGSGRIDLTGRPLAEMAYMRVAYDLDLIRIGVIPLHEYREKHSPSAWKMTNAIESWTWEGFEGKKTLVEVYSKAKWVSLKLNGTIIGSKRPNHRGVARFRTTYFPGTLEAIGVDGPENSTHSTSISTAQSETKVTLVPENQEVTTSDLAYVRVQITDQYCSLKPLFNIPVRIQVSNGDLIGYGNACPYNKEGYISDVSDTYYGEALAIIKPKAPGKVTVSASSSLGSSSTTIHVKKYNKVYL